MQDNIDDMIKEDGTPFISFEKAWAGLKPALDAEAARREKRKRRIIFFWFTCIAVGLGAGIFIFENRKHIEHLAMKQNDIKKETYSNYENKNKDIDTDELKEKNKTIIKTNAQEESSILSKDKSSVKAKEVITQTKETQGVFTDSKNKIASLHITQSKSSDNIRTTAKGSIKPSNQLIAAKTTTKNKLSGNGLEGQNVPQETNDMNVTEAFTDKVESSKPVVAQTNSSHPNTESKTIDSINKLKDSSVVKASVASASVSKEKKSKISKTNAIHYGLQWNLPVQKGTNFLDVNSVNQPATLLIPQFFVSKQISKKHSLVLAFNPYAQYYLNNKAVIDFSKYDVTIYSGSQSNSKPENITYTETTAFNKLISIEASLLYQYQLSSKIKIGLGIANRWINAALIQNKVIKNGTLVTRDSLYGIDKNDKAFSDLRPSFLTGKIETQYQLKKFGIGLTLALPLSNPFRNSQFNIPLNTNLFLRYSW